MRSVAVYHTGPRAVETVIEDVAPPREGQVLVVANASAISAGTELLYYRGKVGQGTPLDVNLPSLKGGMEYPFKYGYASVGRIKSLGDGVSREWDDARVYSFHPHEGAYCVSTDELIRLPDTLSDDDALFFASMETAASVAMDASPIIGEDAVVLGQGMIGILTTAVLSRYPLNTLTAVDPSPSRRSLSKEFGATSAIDSSIGPNVILKEAGVGDRRADIVIELSGNPDALNLALCLVGHEGRIVIGSWYGTKEANIDLGTRFHRGRIKLIGSQVSSLGPSLTGRWDKQRRYGLVARLLEDLRPSRLITHRFPASKAEDAFSLLDRETEKVGQVVLDYRGIGE